MFAAKVPPFAPVRPAPRAPLAAAALLAALALLALGCGGDIEARMAEVRALQDVGQFTESIDELREILSISPDLPEATYRLGVALVQTGEPSRAIWALEKAAESDEYAVPAGLLLASAHFASQNFEATVRAADRVLELDPERMAALHMRAKGNLGAGRLEEALTDTNRLLEDQPDDYSIYALYATILADLERTEEARAAHDRLKEIALASGDPADGPRGCIAPALFARDTLQDMKRAEELYDDCVERFPTNGFVAGEAMRFYDQIDKPAKATEMIRKAVEAAPENLSLRSQLSGRLQRQGDMAGAERVLSEAVESFKSAGAWNLLAEFYKDQGQHQKALEALEKVTELSGGGSDQLRFAHADVLIDVGRLDEAEKIAASLQQPTYATLLRGRIALVSGDPKRALELFEEGIRAWPNNPGARFLAGLAAQQIGDTDRAISELREAVRVENAATAAAEALARIYFDLGEYRDSIRFGKLAAKRRNANLADIYVVGARAFRELENYEEARSTIASLRQIAGQEARAIAELAAVEREASGSEAAVAAIDASGLDLRDPANEIALRAYVDELLRLGRAEAAVAKVDRAIAAHPDSAVLHALRGSVLIRNGDEAGAKASLDRALALDDGDASAHAGMATLAARQNDLPKAVAEFDRAAELAPDTSAYPYSAAQLSLAAGDKPGAEQRLREVVKRFPSHSGARNDLAWLLAEKGEDLDFALALAQQAQRMDPSPDVLDTLGWVRFKRGEISAAVAVLEQAVEARSDSPSLRYRLGMALSRSGDSARAREMLQAAIASGSFPEAADAQRELAQLTP